MLLLMRSMFIRKQAFYYVLDDKAKLRVHPLLIHPHEVVATINVRFIYLKLLIPILEICLVCSFPTAHF